MTQAEELNALQEKFNAFPIAGPVNAAIDEFTQNFKPENAIQIGDKFPDFNLSDATGKQVSRADLLAKAPLLITFYRGEWCPYCNIALQYLQRHLDDFKSKGVTLVAMTPEKPDFSLTTAEKNEIQFPVLTDLHNEVAKKLGIIYNQSSARDLHVQLGVNMAERNGDDSYDMPIPATLLVDGSGIVRNAYLEPDYRKRMDPKVALEWIDALTK